MKLMYRHHHSFLRISSIPACRSKLLIYIILLGFTLLTPPSLNANEEVSKNLKNWQIKGVFAALDDEIPEVRALALKNLYELELINLLSKKQIEAVANFLDSPHENVRIEAVISMGYRTKLSRKHILKLVGFRKDIETPIGWAAVLSLSRQGELAKDHISEIAKLLNYPNQDVRITALQAMGNMGELASEYIHQIAARLNDNKRVCVYALDTLGKLGNLSKDYIPRIAELLDDNTYMVRSAALLAIGNLGTLSKQFIPQIIEILGDDFEDYLSKDAATAIGNLGELCKSYIPRIATLLNESNDDIRRSALLALGNLGILAKNYIPKIEKELEKSSYTTVLAAVVRALGNMGDLSKQERYISWLKELIGNNDGNIKSEAIWALVNLGNLPVDRIPQISKFIKDYEYAPRYLAAEALEKLGKIPHKYIPYIVTFLIDEDPYIRKTAAKILSNQGKIASKYIVYILDPIYKRSAFSSEYRFLVHLLGGGNRQIETLLKWLGEPKENYPQNFTKKEAIETLTAFKNFWDSVESFNKLRSDLVRQIAFVIGKLEDKWQKEDVSLLETMAEKLKDTIYADSLKKIISSIKNRNYLYLLPGTGLLHLLLWVFLFWVYPRSFHVQTIFFWNSSIRNIVGLGYVSFLIIQIPFLRRKLFEPFRESMLENSLIKVLNPMHFKSLQLKPKNSSDSVPVNATAPKLKGHVIIESDAEFDPSAYLSYLITLRHRLAIFLPAENCSRSIVEIIQAKMKGIPKDVWLLKKLLYSGTIDIYITGLHNVNSDSRADVIQFMKSNPKANIIVGTQHIQWKPPAASEIYMLKPIEKNRDKKMFGENNIG